MKSYKPCWNSLKKKVCRERLSDVGIKGLTSEYHQLLLSQRHLSGIHMIKWIEYLNARSEYDELIQGMAGVPYIYEQGKPESMKWFLKRGARGNRFRRDYEKLVNACQTGLCVIEEMKEDDAN